MTHLCYTLEEAAEKLKLSETVLVRLSQYFKVPRTAYEDVGYLSFKGDLAFTEQDIDFFRQAKERLLSGQSLDEVKGRMREEAGVPAGQSQWREILKDNAKATQGSAYGAYRMLNSPESALPPETGLYGAKMRPQEMKLQNVAGPGVGQVPPNGQYLSGEPTGIREYQDRKPYEKAAEQSFERYKSMHRTGLGKVFENMLREVGGSGSRKRTTASTGGATGYRPSKGKLGNIPEGEPTPRATERKPDAFLPFMKGLGQTSAEKASPKTDPGWEQLLNQAVSHPRNLNVQLKSAAALLRDRALNTLPTRDLRNR